MLSIAQDTAALVGGAAVAADDVVLLEEYAYPVHGVPA